jgi:hypothetical protein
LQIKRFGPAWLLVLLMSVAFGSAAAHAAPAQTAGSAPAGPAQEKDLDAPGIITLAPGQRFRIAVPLRLEAALNLGAANLDITLARNIKLKVPEEDLHLVAVLGSAQAPLRAGEKSVILHGVAPAFAPARAADYHPSDYSIHLGSGNVTNLGTPDEKFIDTDALTNKLQNMKLRLSVSSGK